jgi:hypothetical protein
VAKQISDGPNAQSVGEHLRGRWAFRAQARAAGGDPRVDLLDGALQRERRQVAPPRSSGATETS